MGACKDCRYSYTTSFEAKNNTVTITVCTLTNIIVIPDKENYCECFNRDLSKYDICYNCKYYRGGRDWGLFCAHDKMYHHLGNFSDYPCDYYERKEDC